MDDPFSPIANHYDAIMEHVDYARWRNVTATLAEMLPRPLFHLDAACGTGVLLHQLDGREWRGFGVDLSGSMLAVARKQRALTRLARADLCALPFQGRFHLVTSLFDSLNFLLNEEQVRQTMGSFFFALRDGGLLYFDVVTRRMVADHFDDEDWTENHGRFQSSWHSVYDDETRVCETRVRINTGIASVTRERIHDTEFLCDAVRDAGLDLLAMRDAHTWTSPTRRTTRIDFFAAKNADKGLIKTFSTLDKKLKKMAGQSA